MIKSSLLFSHLTIIVLAFISIAVNNVPAFAVGDYEREMFFFFNILLFLKMIWFDYSSQETLK